MELQNESFRISITVDDGLAGLEENDRYDFVYDPDDSRHHDLPVVFSITIHGGGHPIRIGLIGNCLCPTENLAILDGNVLTVLQDRCALQLDAGSGKLIRCKDLDSFGGCWEIHPTPKGDLIYGECEIMMLDAGLNEKWRFSGKDIFASISGKTSFEISEDRIRLYDFEDNYYELDLDGRLLRQILNPQPPRD